MITVAVVLAVLTVAMVAMATSHPDVSAKLGDEIRSLTGFVARHGDRLAVWLITPRFRVRAPYSARHRADGTGAPQWQAGAA